MNNFSSGSKKKGAAFLRQKMSIHGGEGGLFGDHYATGTFGPLTDSNKVKRRDG